MMRMSPEITLLILVWIGETVSEIGGYGGSYSRANAAVRDVGNNYADGSYPGNAQRSANAQGPTFGQLRPAANAEPQGSFRPAGQPPQQNGNFNGQQPTQGNVNQNQNRWPQPQQPHQQTPQNGPQQQQQLYNQQNVVSTGPAKSGLQGQDVNAAMKTLQQPIAPFLPPKARCECYIATLAGNDTSREFMDLLLPFGISQTVATDRTDTTCRELETQCIQHCRIQQESCLGQGLRTPVPGQSNNISYGSYACKTINMPEETRRPAAVFYALNAMYCKDEGYINALDDMYCCLNVKHPFLEGETLRLFSPSCSDSFNGTRTGTGNETQVRSSSNSTEPTVGNSTTAAATSTTPATASVTTVPPTTQAATNGTNSSNSTVTTKSLNVGGNGTNSVPVLVTTQVPAVSSTATSTIPLPTTASTVANSTLPGSLNSIGSGSNGTTLTPSPGSNGTLQNPAPANSTANEFVAPSGNITNVPSSDNGTAGFTTTPGLGTSGTETVLSGTVGPVSISANISDNRIQFSLNVSNPTGEPVTATLPTTFSGGNAGSNQGFLETTTFNSGGNAGFATDFVGSITPGGMDNSNTGFTQAQNVGI